MGELPAIVADFRQAARNAREAGFDAVEIHGANGFLLDQFLQDGSNRRTDAYGGTIENRARLLFEVVDGVADDIGKDRVAVRLSPHGNLGGLSDSDTIPHFSYVIDELGKRGLAYLHLIEPRASSVGFADDASVDSADNASLFRHLFDGPMITAGGYTPEMGVAAVERGLADAVAFGRMFIANPDLPARIRTGAPLNAFDRSTSYGGDAHGYTDYPTLRVGRRRVDRIGRLSLPEESRHDDGDKSSNQILQGTPGPKFSGAQPRKHLRRHSLITLPSTPRSPLDRSSGPVDLRQFFDASRTMYEAINFTHETNAQHRGPASNGRETFQGEEYRRHDDPGLRCRWTDRAASNSIIDLTSR